MIILGRFQVLIQQEEKFYALRSRARAIQVREELQILKKGSLTISEYMLTIKMLCDKLDDASRGLTEEQKLMTVLGGLVENLRIMIVFFQH